MNENVWTAVRNPEARPFQWQPALEGVGVLDIWFNTEAECVQFIKDEILGAELAEECC